jgi:DNA-binding FadR family transcriptional regulator
VGVSRNVLREAFRVLQERGIILSRTADGRYLRPLCLALDHSNDAIGQLEIATILESREILESAAVSLGCARITPIDVAPLRAAASRNNPWADNLEFHTTLASVTHNDMLERPVKQQIELLQEVHQRDHYVRRSRSRDLLQKHSEIAEAMIARDANRAQALMRAHLQHTRRQHPKRRSPKARRGRLVLDDQAKQMAMPEYSNA